MHMALHLFQIYDIRKTFWDFYADFQRFTKMGQGQCPETRNFVFCYLILGISLKLDKCNIWLPDILFITRAQWVSSPFIWFWEFLLRAWWISSLITGFIEFVLRIWWITSLITWFLHHCPHFRFRLHFPCLHLHRKLLFPAKTIYIFFMKKKSSFFPSNKIKVNIKH